MSKRKRKRRGGARRGWRPGSPRTHHVYPKGWKKTDWVVPFSDSEHALIHHGHGTAPDDHSLCGPALFCCQKAISLYCHILPDSAEASANWFLTEAADIATWMDAGVHVLYFVFCDPQPPHGLLAIGLGGDVAREVLLKEVPLDDFAAEARRLGGDEGQAAEGAGSGWVP